MALAYYDLNKPQHQALIQKFPIGSNFNRVMSMRSTKYENTGYLYMLVTHNLGSDNEIQNNETFASTMLTIRINENFIARIPEEQMSLFSHYDSLTFNVKQKNVSQLGLERKIDVKFVKTGYMLEPLTDKINMLVVNGEGNVTLNLDQYFTGYRQHIDVVYPQKYEGHEAKSIAENGDLVTIEHNNIALMGKYEFASIQEGHQTQKALIYIGHNEYVYVD
jgi:hypothetical protein